MRAPAFANKSLWLLLASSLWLAACTAPPTAKITMPVGRVAPEFMVSKWEMLPDWPTPDLTASWPALLQSCHAFRFKPVWLPICAAAAKVDAGDAAAQREFYETWFTPYQLFNPDGSDSGLVTGYYEPLLTGSRTRTRRFAYPIYAPPDDMLEVDLGDFYPQLRGQRIRARLDGKRVVPYYNRAEIDAGLDEALKGHELFWVDDPIALFFLQIQGSGRIELQDGTRVKVGYADQNGQAYASIGRILVNTGELTLDQASMQGIKAWAERNPEKLPILLGQNPSYVFFRVLPDNLSAPLGALGVPLTSEYSIAVDPRTVPLGLPVFLATTRPNSSEPLDRLTFAQDTGGAIRGAVRADFFWGFGPYAAARAGSMKQQGRMWVLFPHGAEPALD